MREEEAAEDEAELLHTLIYNFCLWEKHPNLLLIIYQEKLAWTSMLRWLTEYRHLLTSSSHSLTRRRVGLLLKGVRMKAHPTKLNPKLPKGKARLHAIDLPKGSETGSTLDVGVEREAKITFFLSFKKIKVFTNFTQAKMQSSQEE